MNQAKTIILEALEAYADILDADIQIIRDRSLANVLRGTVEKVRICRAFLVADDWSHGK